MPTQAGISSCVGPGHRHPQMGDTGSPQHPTFSPGSQQATCSSAVQREDASWAPSALRGCEPVAISESRQSRPTDQAVAVTRSSQVFVVTSDAPSCGFSCLA